MSKPLLNTVWKIEGDNEFSLPIQFRILKVYAYENIAVIYPITNRKKKLYKPMAVALDLTLSLIKDDNIKEHVYKLPPHITFSDSELEQKWKDKRKKNYAIIKPLISDEKFLYNLVQPTRAKDVVERAAELELAPSTVYRLLNLYWKYGQLETSLNPSYINSGGKGKQKKASNKKRGKPPKRSEFGFSVPLGLNVLEEDKQKIKDAVKEHYEKKRKPKKSSIWKTFKKRYSDEIFSAELSKRPAEFPNYRQFCYWLPILVDETALEKKEIGEIFWEKDHRQLLGSVSENVNAPGDRFEIDSTVADVYVVSEANPEIVIGRPVIYVVVDEASRIVAGLYVSIYAASFEEAKQALLNAFLSKEDYFKKHNLNYSDSDWPCHHIPRCLLADRFEFLGKQSEEHAEPLGLQIQLASAFRADWKGVVERKFGIANEESLHHLAGTTRGVIRKRGEKVPSEYAFYTLNEITKLLITLFVEYNKNKQIDDILTRDLIKNNIPPTPLNFWNFYVGKNLDSLSTISSEQARAELLPSTTATITGQGIHCDGLWYTCKKAEDEQWYVIARRTKSWKVSARTEGDNSGSIWIRPESNCRLIHCHLLNKSHLYSNLHKADVVYINEWIKNKKTSPDSDAGDVRYQKLLDEIDKNAKKDGRSKSRKTSHNKKGNSIRQNRKNEQAGLAQNKKSKSTNEKERARTFDPDGQYLSFIKNIE
ncbi:MAG: transposase family protein [Bacteroidetes bacterium]|nr:transposase family protein [Bacteroidota bacterium]